MAFVTIQQQTLPNWQHGGTTGFFRVFASQSFYEYTTGVLVPQGIPTQVSSFCLEVECTIDGTDFLIPEITLATTTDSNVPNTVYTAVCYNSSNVQMYTLLANFFLDPQYFQSPAESSVTVANAGTDSVNAETYAYNGQSAGFGYYNPTGETASTTLFTIVNTGSQWRIYDSGGTNRYHGTLQTEFPWDEVWTTGSGSTGALPVPNVSQNNDLVVATWEQVTISKQGFAAVTPPFAYPGPFWDVPQIKEYVNSLVGDGTTPFANRLVAGKTKLDTAPLLSTSPIAVATNSNRINRVLSEDYANNIASAITALSGTPSTLVIKEDAIVSAPLTVPAEVYLDFQNNAVLSKTSTGSITFEGFGLVNAASKQACFQGFAIGGVVWTGDEFPSEVSTELWDTEDGSLTNRFKRADAAMVGNPCQITAYPRTIDGSGILTENHTLYFSDGEYENTLATYGITNLPAFLLDDNTRVTGSNLAFINESPTAGNTYLFYAHHMRINTNLTNENIIIEGLNFVGNASQSGIGDNSVILLGNCQNSSIRNCQFYRMHGYTTQIGGHGDSGNYAYNSDISNNIFIGIAQQTAIITNGKNCAIRANLFDLSNTYGGVNSYNYVPIDVEPNSANDILENIFVEDNFFDYTNEATNGTRFSSAIAIQGASIGTVYAVFIRGNTILGPNITSPYLTPVQTAIGAYGIQELVVEDNYLRGAYATPINIYSVRYAQIFNNKAIECAALQSSYQPQGVLVLAGVANSDISNNRFNNGWASISGATTAIAETEEYFTVTTSGSTVTNTFTLQLRFYDFWADGLSVTINGADYTVSAVADYLHLTTGTAVGTVAPQTFTSADVTTGTGNIAITNHGYLTGCALYPTTAGTLPVNASLTSGVVTYVIRVDNNNIKLAATLADANANVPLTYSGAGSGTSTLTPVLTTKFSSNTYNNNKADDGITLFPGGASQVLSDYRVVRSDSIAVTISSNQNNYNPGRNAHRIDVTTDASRNLTGLVFTQPPQGNGEKHRIYNAGSFDLVLKNNATSTAANRFLCVTGADITLTPGMMAFVEYDSTAARWITWSTAIASGSLPTGIDAANIADGTVSNAEFQRINSLTSNAQTQLDSLNTLKAPKADPTFTGTTTIATLASTTSDIGTATGTSLITSNRVKSTGTGGIGYATGAGGAVTQITSRTTSVTLDKTSGAITLFSAAGSATPASFTVTNSTVAATDTVSISQKSGTDKYAAIVSAVGAGSFEITFWDTTGTATESPVFNFNVFKGVAS